MAVTGKTANYLVFNLKFVKLNYSDFEARFTNMLYYLCFEEIS